MTIHNSSTNNFEQGKLYYDQKNNIKKKNKDKLLENSSKLLAYNNKELIDNSIVKNISVSEGFIGSVAQVPLDRALPGRANSPFAPPPTKFSLDINSKIIDNPHITKLVDKFNNILSSYTTQYNLMMDELIHNNQQIVLQKYGNNNIKFNNNYYYVNEYGFAHPYDNDEWNNRSVSCSKRPVTITSDEFNKLVKGPNMGLGQACNVAGFNIENSDTKEVSWVDIKGTRHIYSADTWNNRNDSCQLTPKTLNPSEYNQIPKGSNMEDNTFCERLNVDPKILQNLSNLNKQLLDLGNNLVEQTNNLSLKETGLKAEIQIAQRQLVEKLNQLQKEQHNFDSDQTVIGHSGDVSLGNYDINRTIEASTRDSQIKLRMNYLKYMLGLIITIILVVFTFYNYSSNRSSTFSIIIVGILILILIYNLFIYLKNAIF